MYQLCRSRAFYTERNLLLTVPIWGRLKLQDRKMQDWKMTDKSAGLENAGLEIDGQKLQGVENDGHIVIK